MKRIFSIILIAAAAASCSNGNSFTVKGTLTPTDDVNGALVVMHNSTTGKADTTTVINGEFTFKGEADPTMLYSIYLDKKGPNVHNATFIPEPGVIIVDLDSTDRVQAGPLTESLHQFITELRSAADEESANAAIDKAFASNKDNVIGQIALGQKLFAFESQSELDEYIADAADFIKEDESVQKMRTALSAVEATAAGCMFKDIAGADAAGEPLALSDFAGKGKYVLIDFWASWCGPCRREIPYLVEIDKDYADKGVQVVGINVWDKKDAALKAVEQ
ncbi:MAG: AhpC/TSA family protein, partial [Bacteroidales bacterium]|nr:AhpC/TSA family protein [Bacteroidales bacterium]